MALFASFRSRRTARRAEQVFARDGFAAAAAVLDGATSLGGGSWAQFAVGLYNQGYKVEAERAIRRALEVEAGRGDALIFLAELLAETEREDEAIETYRQVLARFPGAAA
jgi:tetratricopeptide (TPR) repeat protein